MANNIKGNAPNAVVAMATVSFTGAGITGSNTSIIYLVDNPLKSYIPGRSINAITGFEEGLGYYLVAKTDMDLSAYLIPPVPALAQLATPGSFTATPGDTQNVLDWANVTSATSYIVDRATNVGFTTGVALGIYTGSTSAYTDTGRTNGVQYFYRVRATAAGFADSAYATANATPTSGTITLVDKTFSDATGWTFANDGLSTGDLSRVDTTDGGVSKAHFKSDVNTMYATLDAGLPGVTPGDQLRLTVVANVITPNTVNASPNVYFFAASTVQGSRYFANLVTGTNTIDIDTTGWTTSGLGVAIELYHEPTGSVLLEAYIRSIKIEKL